MKKTNVLIYGCSSWWKSKKYRKESYLKLMELKSENWKVYKVDKLLNTPYSIDTKVYKKYHLVK